MNGGLFYHGGDTGRYAEESGLKPGEITDFSANLNPLGPPSWLKPLLDDVYGDITKYPDPGASGFVRAVSQKTGEPESNIVPGNGATELLRAIPAALRVKRGVIPVPSYTDYEKACLLARMEVETVECREADSFAIHADALRRTIRDGDIVFIGRPNNPTGHVMGGDELRELALSSPSSAFVVDESFGGFVEGFDSLAIRRPGNVIVVVSLTKLFCIPGLRAGYLVADEKIASAIRDHIPPWSMNTFAQAAAARAVMDDGYVAASQKFVRERRDELIKNIGPIGAFTVFPPAANFILARINVDGLDCHALYSRMLKKGAAIRRCDNFRGLGSRYFRVAVRGEKENAKLVAALEDAIR
ncbi:MAG: threonine-phosphate decarboxylase [Nitrospinae bacterium]|nr:threonine-phosphate decarboxylase [Nitrospinota bacterium]